MNVQKECITILAWHAINADLLSSSNVANLALQTGYSTICQEGPKSMDKYNGHSAVQTFLGDI